MDNETNTTENPIPTNPTDIKLQQSTSTSISNQKKFQVIICSVVILVIIITSYFLVTLGKTAPNQEQLQTIRTQSHDLLSHLQYANAAKKAEEGLQIQKSDKDLLLVTLQAIAAEGNRTGKEKEALSQAQQFIDEARKTNPTDPKILTTIGYLYEIAGNYSDALSFYNKAIAINPRSAEAYFHRGHTYEFLGKQKEGFADYETAYAIDPTQALVLEAKGREASLKGDNTQAADFFIKAAAATDATQAIRAEALTGASLAKQTNLMGMFEAIDLAQQATQADPKYSQGLGQYGFTILFKGKVTESITYLNRAIDANPRIAANYWMRAVALRDSGEYQSAIDSLHTAFAKVDNDNTIIGSESTNKMRAQILYELASTNSIANTGNPSDTVNWLAQAIHLDPSKKDVLQTDYAGGFFQSLTPNEKFQQLIK